MYFFYLHIRKGLLPAVLSFLGTLYPNSKLLKYEINKYWNNYKISNGYEYRKLKTNAFI